MKSSGGWKQQDCGLLIYRTHLKCVIWRDTKAVFKATGLG